MENDLVAQLSALAHPQRLALFRLLMRRYPDRLPAGEIGQVLNARPSTQSAWLSDLSEAGLIDAERRGTQLLYRARLDRVQGMLAQLLSDAARGRADPPPAPSPGRVRNVLFVGTGNAARSLMAEALLRDIDPRRYEALSAGTSVGDEPNPQAMAMLSELGHDTAQLWAKPVSGFLEVGAPRLDLVITLCDAAANSDLPVWPGNPVQGHWGLPDPIALGTADAYAEVYLTLRARLSALAELPEELSRDRMQAALNDLALIRGPVAEADG
jgi:ArsR family transcriptional regulator, arsenate/arsenite/antimonite-responsive transcriptional repressor / arsenate reductase (thioredoxin)